MRGGGREGREVEGRGRERGRQKKSFSALLSVAKIASCKKKRAKRPRYLKGGGGRAMRKNCRITAQLTL